MKRSKARRFDILTLFPGMFEGPLTESLLGRAVKNGLVHFEITNFRDFSQDVKHHAVDDRPYGGGVGMVLQAEPVYRALMHVKKLGRKMLGRSAAPQVVLLSPQGRMLTQVVAEELAQRPWIVFVCGHYEGVDERVMDWIDEEISIGDFVLTGGEIPAMVMTDAVVRLVPGVVKESDSVLQDSFQDGRLDHPHYTRPAVWRGKQVPSVLLSGDHRKIKAWREEKALEATRRKRPDLLTRSSGK